MTDEQAGELLSLTVEHLKALRQSAERTHVELAAVRQDIGELRQGLAATNARMDDLGEGLGGQIISLRKEMIARFEALEHVTELGFRGVHRSQMALEERVRKLEER